MLALSAAESRGRRTAWQVPSSSVGSPRWQKSGVPPPQQLASVLQGSPACEHLECGVGAGCAGRGEPVGLVLGSRHLTKPTHTGNRPLTGTQLTCRSRPSRESQHRSNRCCSSTQRYPGKCTAGEARQASRCVRRQVRGRPEGSRMHETPRVNCGASSPQLPLTDWHVPCMATSSASWHTGSASEQQSVSVAQDWFGSQPVLQQRVGGVVR